MNKYVFVVCGAREHIEELNFSLECLRKHTKNEIIVITDKLRNEIEIKHSNIINVDTPKQYNNHEASIFLKTGINKFLPKGNIYCYLDGDVVCVSNNVDKVFESYVRPITFAKDHSPFKYFSPYALNCKCHEDNEKRKKIYLDFLNLVSKEIGSFNFNDEDVKKQSDILVNELNKMKHSFFKIIKYAFYRYCPFIKSFYWEHFLFHKSKRYWTDKQDRIVLFDFSYYKKKILPQLGENPHHQNWKFDTPQCSHLSEYIKKAYSVSIPNNWQHWNGGVFLFDDSSEDFLDYWHKKTTDEFLNPYTKTRDQGTLALSAWKFGLQNHPTLSKEFNWIAEYSDKSIDYNSEKGYTYDNFKTSFHPSLIHIYHHWGRKDWSIWQSVEKVREKE